MTTTTNDARPSNRDRIRPPGRSPSTAAGTIFAIWAAAAIPMGVLAWVVAPAIADGDSAESLFQPLVACLTVGLVWQFVLVVVLVGREQGTLRWSVVRDALWLRSPRSPKTGKVGGKLWWLVVPDHARPGHRGDRSRSRRRSTGTWASSSRPTPPRRMFHGSWGLFALVRHDVSFNTVLGEELLFRGVLLPRMSGAFGSATGCQRPAARGVPPAHAVGRSRRRSSTCSSSPTPPAATAARCSASSCTACNGDVHRPAAHPRAVGRQHLATYCRNSQPRSSDLGCVTRRTARSPRDIGWDTTRHDRPARVGAGPGSRQGPRAGRRSGRSGAIRRTGRVRRSSVAEQRHPDPGEERHRQCGGRPPRR